MADTINIGTILTGKEDKLEKGVSFKIKEEDEFLSINSKLTVKLKIKRINEEKILTYFKVPVEIKLTCVRCLERFNFKEDLKFQRVYSKDPKEKEEPIKNSRIDIKKPIKDEIILNLPLKPVCNKDCKGLCIECGQNLNEAECDCKEENKGRDEFEKLKKLKIHKAKKDDKNNK